MPANSEPTAIFLASGRSADFAEGDEPPPSKMEVEDAFEGGREYWKLFQDAMQEVLASKDKRDIGKRIIDGYITRMGKTP